VLQSRLWLSVKGRQSDGVISSPDYRLRNSTGIYTNYITQNNKICPSMRCSYMYMLFASNFEYFYARKIPFDMQILTILVCWVFSSSDFNHNLGPKKFLLNHKSQWNEHVHAKYQRCVIVFTKYTKFHDACSIYTLIYCSVIWFHFLEIPRNNSQITSYYP
jgi:hypothetical protein